MKIDKNLGKKATKFEGPTAERLIKSDGYVAIGDDKQGTRVYHMLDSVLDRTYSDLRVKLGSAEEDGLRLEYAALKKMLDLYEVGRMMGNLPSVDFGNSGVQDSAGRDHAAKTDGQVAARFSFHAAKDKLSVWQWKVVEMVVLNDQALIDAGFEIGCKSRTRAFVKAKIVLRGSGELLANHWGMKR